MPGRKTMAAIRARVPSSQVERSAVGLRREGDRGRSGEARQGLDTFMGQLLFAAVGRGHGIERGAALDPMRAERDQLPGAQVDIHTWSGSR